MLKTYHHLFRFNKDNNNDYLLSSFASYYNHVYHHAYALWAKQQSIIFSHQRTLTHQQLIHQFYQQNNINNKKEINKNISCKIPDLSFTLSSEHKKQIIATKHISSRQLNSIHFQLQGNLKSLYELKQLDLKQKLEKLNTLNKDILLLKQKIKSQLVLLAYDKNHKQLLHETYLQYKIFKSIPKNKHKKFIFNNNLNISESLVKTKYKLYNLITKRNNLQPKINKLIIQFMTGKLPLCFGTKKLFHKQHNLPYYHNKFSSLSSSYYIYPYKKDNKDKINPKSNHKHYFDLWKQEFNETRNNSFYLVGAATETSGNQSCQAIIQYNKQENINDNGKKSLITLKIRLPDAILLKNNPILNNEIKNIKIGTDDNYIFLRDLDFGIYHHKLVQAINNNHSQDKTLHTNINYRFERNINKNSPKYGSWTISFQLEEEDKPIISNTNCGGIGIDLNQEHVSVAEIDHKGNLVNHYDIPMKLSYFQELYHGNPGMRNKNSITTLSSNQSAWLIEQIVIKLCHEAKEKAKPIIVEKLDFEYKKNTLSDNKNNAYTKKRNKQLSAFVYSKFKQALLTRAKKEGIEIIPINPAYTSLIGLVKYQKVKGLSVHQAASYVIARKGLNYKEFLKFNLDEKVKVGNNSKDNLSNINSSKKEVKYDIIYRGRIIEVLAPVRKLKDSCRNNFTLLKVLNKSVKKEKDKINLLLSKNNKSFIFNPKYRGY